MRFLYIDIDTLPAWHTEEIRVLRYGEAFGELGVFSGLQYHLDIAAPVVDLADIAVPTDWWSGESTKAELDAGTDRGLGRDAQRPIPRRCPSGHVNPDEPTLIRSTRR